MKPTLAENTPAAEISKAQIESNALEVLKAADVNQRRGKSRMAPLLVEEGLGLEEIARKLNTFASYSDDESIQFQATKLALQLHGELEKDNAKETGVQIVFNGVSPEMMAVLVPRS